jgi:hypothetical protein
MTRRFSVDPQERTLIMRALGRNPNSDVILSVAKRFDRQVSVVSAIAMGRPVA